MNYTCIFCNYDLDLNDQLKMGCRCLNLQYSYMNKILYIDCHILKNELKLTHNNKYTLIYFINDNVLQFVKQVNTRWGGVSEETILFSINYNILSCNEKQIIKLIRNNLILK